jgi:signal peptidase I
MVITRETGIAMKRRTKTTLLILACLILLIILVFAYSFLAKHEIRTIATGAMAPALLGPHVYLTCPNCSYRWPIGVPGPRRNPFLGDFECPNCGTPFRQNVDTGKCVAGNRVVFVKTARPSEEIHRWDIVVFYPEREGKSPFAMRLVGLPGESIYIYNGDIYINGKIARKPPDVQDKLLIEVYNSACIPKNGKSPWLFNEKLWKMDKGKLSVSLSDKGTEAGSFAEFTGKLDSSLPYNMLYDSGDAEWNEDVVLEYTFRLLSSSGAIGVVVETGDDLSCEFQLTIEIENEEGSGARLRIRTEAEDTGSSIALPELGKEHNVRFSMLDGVARLFLDGKEILNVELDKATLVPDRPKVIINAEGCDCVFSGIRILKDNYYTTRNSEVSIPAGHYFFLGDNSEFSRDSRNFGAIPEKRIVGRVTGIK